MTIFLTSGKWLMMVNQTGNRIKRHIASRIVLNINIAEELVSQVVGDSEDTVNSGRILVDPGIRKSGHLGVIIGQVPHIKTLSILGSHLTRHTGRLIAVVSPCFLIAKHFIILGIALSINFLV